MRVLLKKVSEREAPGGTWRHIQYSNASLPTTYAHEKLRSDVVGNVNDSPCHCTGSAYQRCPTRPFGL